MQEVRLQYGDKEFLMNAGVTTIGRTDDNFISFPEDSNVSRYHAEIESRGGEYCLIDLNSSNGTTVNGSRVNGEVYLKEGDVIVLGGTSKIFFGKQKEAAEAEATAKSEPALANVRETSATIPTRKTSEPAAAGSRKLLFIAGAICCIAILFVVVAGAVYYFSGSSCSATAVFLNPEMGETIDKATDVEINVKNGACVAQVVYTVNGKPIATTLEPPFTASLDPRNFPELSDGSDHVLGVVLVDRNGNQMPQQNTVLVAFETRRLKAPEPSPTIVTGSQEPGLGGPKTKGVSLIELQQMTTALGSQLAGGRKYNVSNPQFLKEVQKRTAEFAKAGYFERASKYRDVINVSYVSEQNLDAQIGYMLAMSRSGFDPAKKGNEEGLWRMTTEFVAANRYNGLCGTESLSDASQNCAAKASALYMKEIVIGVFEGDIIYGVAAFGKSTADAAAWKSTLPANRTDVWNSIRTAPEREQLVRFFAAGIVSENPQRFGLKNDRPLSELYRLTL